jgi:tetratricopeptide (TPR) repeat protein
LIPNLERIKIEKAQTAKEVKLKQLEQTEPNADTQSISFDNDAGEISELGNYPLTNKYFESVFSLTDLYLYRGVSLFYLQRYAEAIKDFEVASRETVKSVFEQT